jgi:hypothetical protein
MLGQQEDDNRDFKSLLPLSCPLLRTLKCFEPEEDTNTNNSVYQYQIWRILKEFLPNSLPSWMSDLFRKELSNGIGWCLSRKNNAEQRGIW